MSDARRQVGHHRRYEAACERLENAWRLARLALAADRLRTSETPKAVIIAGKSQVERALRVGLFPGSFNPLTHAHVAMANAARRAASLDVLLWGVALASIDKERVQRAALPDRLAQLQAFVAGRRGHAAILLNRGLYVDQATATRALLRQDADLHVVVGFDKIVQIFDPHYYDDRTSALDTLFSLTRFLVAPRAGDGEDALNVLLSRPENRDYAKRVAYLSLPPQFATDSSTEAREMLACGADDAALAKLLPPEGLALAHCTGAFAASEDVAVADDYALRQRWIEILAGGPPQLVKKLPSLSTLVEMTRRDDRRGHALQNWLASPGHIPVIVRNAIFSELAQ
jgi:nicotinamide-nucleotide adenylyltransferase